MADADSLGAAFVEVRGDLSKLPGDLSGAGGVLKHAFSGFTAGGAAEGLAGIAAGFVGIAAPAAVASKAMQEWRENSTRATAAAKEQYDADLRLMAALEATGHAAGVSFEELKKQANEIQDATGVADESIEAFQQKLLNFSAVQGQTFKRATQAAVEWSESTGRSLPGLAKALGRALSDPAKGMALLTLQGVMLSASQQQLIKDFMKAGDRASAQGIILEGLEKKFGKFAENTMTPVKKLKVELAELDEKLGDLYRQREPVELQVKIVTESIQVGLEEAFANVLNDVGSLFGKAVDAGEIGKLIGDQAGIQLKLGLAAIMPWWLTGAIAVNKVANAGNNPAISPKNTSGKKGGTGPGESEMPAGKESKAMGQGFFDPLALYRQLQSTALSKDDQMIAAVQEGNSIQQKILELAMAADREEITLADE